MERETRQQIERLTAQGRRLLEGEFREQLEGHYDIGLDGRTGVAPGSHLSAPERVTWEKLLAAIAHKKASGATPAGAAASLLREMSFNTLNRFVALKMLESRKLLQECVSRGEDSAGFKEFGLLASGLSSLPDRGWRLYVETIFDEVAQEVRCLFDRRDVAALLWPRRQALLSLLSILNAPEAAPVWREDETIGWVYQYFNDEEERRQMRDPKAGGSQAPRNSRELAVRNQFFTPRYVVRFLVDNTLARAWCEMRGGRTQLLDREYLVTEGGFDRRIMKDPRDIAILDPACGSGHFLLYCFDLLAGEPRSGLAGIYEEAWRDADSPPSLATGRTLRQDHPTVEELRRAVPELVLRHNLHGVDIDPRAAQIASLALWMRAQRAWNDHGVPPAERREIKLTRVATAEPMPGDRAMVEDFARRLDPPLLGDLFRRMVEEMKLAGELGTLLRVEAILGASVARARAQHDRERQTFIPGLGPARKGQDFDLSGVSDKRFFDSAEERMVAALQDYAALAAGGRGVRHRLFAEDATEGMAFMDICRRRYDVVLMNPPFGAGSMAAKKEFEEAYPRTKNDLYAAFVERGVDLLEPGGLLGAITSRTGFFLSSFQKWREEILLREAPPVVFADLGAGVLDSAMVEVAAYCLQKGGEA